MTLIAHISDLHFGRIFANAGQALLTRLEELSPSLVIISGDITQRARTKQFLAAQGFLAKLKWPYLVMPGNHDLPLHHPIRRILRPLAGYHRYINPDNAPSLVNDELAVLCLNTTMRWHWKSGGAPRPRLDRLQNQLKDLPTVAWRILVTHHPAFPQEEDRIKPWQAKIADLISKYGVGLALSGHFHHTVIRTWGQERLLVVEAGTTTSDRLRAEPNAFNVLALHGDRVEITVYYLVGGSFMPDRRRCFRRGAGAWLEESPPAKRDLV